MDVRKLVTLLEQQKAAIEQAIAALSGSTRRKLRRRQMSEAGRKRIAAAQRKRWKALRASLKRKIR